ncbi:MAG: hypothetical protein MUF54_00540 [Polyangiaceae bacterium]|nr:hypothetical protein [Polyangiaceae bacterium]
MRESDMAIQFTLPSGANSHFYAGNDVPIRLQLSGTAGVSTVPAGHATVHIQPFDTTTSKSIHGQLSFRFRTALDVNAPVYYASGSFDARLCNNGSVEPSVPDLDTTRSPVFGVIAERNVTLASMHAYLRDDGEGNEILMLKGYELDVPCHSTRSATPYLFGAEVGAGIRHDFHKGVEMPVRWSLQMRMGDFSERTVQSDDGAGWLRLDEVALTGRSIVRGRLIATNADEDKRYRFELAGTFEAKVCGRPVRAW